MEIFLNGDSLEIDGMSPATTLSEIIEVVQESLKETGVSIMEIVADGKSFSPDDPEQLSRTTIQDFQKIEITALTPAEIVIQAVSDREANFGHIEGLASSIAENLRIGKTREAMESLVEIMDCLDWLTTMLGNLEKGFIKNLQENELELRRSDISRRLLDQIKNLRETQENRDWVGAADILEYEFPEIFSDCRKLFDEVAQRR